LEAIESGEYKIFYPENNGREGLFHEHPIAFRQGIRNRTVGAPSSECHIRHTGSFRAVLPKRELSKATRTRSDSDTVLIPYGRLFLHIIFSRIGFRASGAHYPHLGVIPDVLAFRKQRFLMERLGAWDIRRRRLRLGIPLVLSYRATPLILAIPAVFLLIESVKGHYFKRFAAIACSFLAGTLIAIAPLASYFFSNPGDFFGRTSQISVFSSVSPIKDLAINVLKTALMFNFAGDANWRHNFSGYPELSVVTGIFFIVGIFVSIKKTFRKFKDSSSELFMFFWIAVSLLPVVISNEGIPHALRAIIAIPGVMVLSAVGMDFLWSKLKEWFSAVRGGNALFKVSAVAILSFLILEPFVAYFILWGKNPNVAGAFNQNYAEIARSINALPKEIEKYVVVLARGVEVRGIPVPHRQCKFMTGSLTQKGMEEKNIRYFGHTKSYRRTGPKRDICCGITFCLEAPWIDCLFKRLKRFSRRLRFRFLFDAPSPEAASSFPK
jgi:hypothetical protein